MNIEERTIYIRELLADRNLTAVSKAIGVHKHTLYNFVKGSDTKVSTLIKLDTYLGG